MGEALPTDAARQQQYQQPNQSRIQCRAGAACVCRQQPPQPARQERKGRGKQANVAQSLSDRSTLREQFSDLKKNNFRNLHIKS